MWNKSKNFTTQKRKKRNRSFIFLRFIPRYFILFDATVNGINFLITLSDSSLLVYINTTDFCTWISYPATLLCWDMPLFTHLVENFYHKSILNFVSSLFSIEIIYHMVLMLQFVNVVHHIGWFVDIEPSLHPWDKSHLIMGTDPFNVLLNLVC